MEPLCDARVSVNNAEQSPRSSGVVVVSRRPEYAGGNASVVIKPTILVRAVRSGLVSDAACSSQLQAAKTLLLLEEPLTKPLGSMQAVRLVAPVSTAAVSGWNGDSLTPTQPRIVLRRLAFNDDIPGAEELPNFDDVADEPPGMTESVSDAPGDGDAKTRPARMRPRKAAVSSAADSGDTLNWARTETSQAFRAAREQLRAQWRSLISSMSQRRNERERAQRLARQGIVAAAHGLPVPQAGPNSRKASPPAQPQLAPHSCRCSRLEACSRYRVRTHAFIIGLIAIAAFVFELTYAVTYMLPQLPAAVRLLIMPAGSPSQTRVVNSSTDGEAALVRGACHE